MILGTPMSGRRATRAQRKRHEEAADWLLRNREADQPASGRAAFQAWLDRDPENLRAYRAVERLMGEARTAIASDPALRDLDVKPAGPARPIAGLLLAAILAGTLFTAFDGPMRLRADVIAGTGEMPVVTLADGSVVQLNAASAIAYDDDGSRRTVRLLRGQAYFEVAHDPRRPFTVEAGDTRVTALGTAFDVRLGEARTDVAVTENAVLVAFDSPDRAPLRVGEGEQMAYDHATGESRLEPGDGLAAHAWRRGLLIVDNAPLSDVVEDMNRHFFGRIVIVGDALSQRRVSGTLAIADTAAALAYLEQAMQVTTTRIGPLIVIR